MISIIKGEESRKDVKKGNKLGGIAILGTIGWYIAIPAVLAIILGKWLNSVTNGSFNWIIILFLIGMSIGFYNVYRVIKKEFYNK